jgi:hypothetical protein
MFSRKKLLRSQRRKTRQDAKKKIFAFFVFFAPLRAEHCILRDGAGSD